MVARLKLKGIDGGSHKRWSMWLNSRLREEPFPDLTCSKEAAGRTRKRERTVSNPEAATGAAWLSSARVVRCRVKSHNERNPYPELQPNGHSRGTAGVKPEEGGDDVKSSWPLCPGLHTCYNDWYKGLRNREVELIPKNQSQFGL
jgi:hypothetical protein